LYCTIAGIVVGAGFVVVAAMVVGVIGGFIGIGAVIVGPCTVVVDLASGI